MPICHKENNHLYIWSGWFPPEVRWHKLPHSGIQIKVGFLSLITNFNFGKDFDNHILEKHSLFNHKMEIDFWLEYFSKRNMTDSSCFLRCSTKTLWTLHLLPSNIFY